MDEKTYVYVDSDGAPELVGVLWSRVRKGHESATFEYQKTWLENPKRFSLEPALMLGPGPYHTDEGKALFGAIGDSAPDRWGRVLMRRAERRLADIEHRAPRTIREIDYLLMVDDEARQGALRFAQTEGGAFVRAGAEERIPPLVELPRLLAAAEHFGEESETQEDIRLLLAPGSSLGGARPKASVRGSNGQLLIAKFPHKMDETNAVLWEALALKLAAKAGITVASWRLEKISAKSALLLQRFDREGMKPKRHQLVEHAILTLVLRYSDHLGYANTLPGLAQILRQTVADIDNREVVDTLKRLRPQYLTLWKWSEEHHRFLEYPAEIPRDEDFFYRSDFQLRHTPHTDPYVQTLALEINPPEVEPVMTPMDDAARNARFERFEKLGLDRVKSDLMNTKRMMVVGGGLDVQNLAWEWVRMKESEAKAEVPQTSHAVLPLISDDRLGELRNLAPAQFDFRKLIRLCEEINISYRSGCYFATAMLIRALLDHVPPIFGKNIFDEVANNYGGKSFKGAMQHLQSASRNVADGHLHQQIRKSETLPTAQQVNCGQQLDVLLSEIVRITR